MAVKKKIVKKTFLVKARETFTQHRRLVIWIVCLVVLAVLLWFVFRKVKVWERERNYEREELLRQRDAARARIVADSISHAQFMDSMYMVAMGMFSGYSRYFTSRKIGV